MKCLTLNNNQVSSYGDIPILDYEEFMQQNTDLLKNDSYSHCVNYFGIREQNSLRLICCIADDLKHQIYVSSSRAELGKKYPSFTAGHLAFEKFEREIHEQFGLEYSDHPWLKPVRYPFDRFDKGQTIANYPFFRINSDELHEVGVGPIHAGVIEPGHFRFICNGEQVPHLEIQLGFQHRAVEHLMLEKSALLQRCTIAENIAGDTAAGHTTAFVNLWESLCKYQAGYALKFDRTLALELERMAIHTADLSALCTDIAYQLGSSVYGPLSVFCQ